VMISELTIPPKKRILGVQKQLFSLANKIKRKPTLVVISLLMDTRKSKIQGFEDRSTERTSLRICNQINERCLQEGKTIRDRVKVIFL
jgi:hypothetical protein